MISSSLLTREPPFKNDLKTCKMEVKCKNTIRLVVRMQQFLVVSNLPLLGMSIISILFEGGPILKLTIYYDGQFYVGIVETVEENTLRAYRYIFGQEPKDQDVLEFVNRNLLSLINRSEQSGISISENIQKRINPKKLQRMVSKEINKVGISTKAHQAIQEGYNLRKKEKLIKTKQHRDEQKQYKREMKVLKAKNKRKGR